MISQWREFLNENGAEFEQDRLLHFGNDERERRAALGGDVMCDLSRYALLAIQGSDARSFLQGQLTNDLDMLSETSSQLNGFCTPKGRLISNFRLIQNGATIFAVIPRDMIKTTMEQLQHYVISADVQMGDASEALVHFGVSGERASTQLEQILGALPAAINDVLQHAKFMAIKVADNRYALFGNVDDSIALWSQLDVHCSAVSGECWQYLNIRDGIPDISSATTEAFVPQMVNLDLIGAINFTKGCYTGQEIVARTHYLGKQKRRMYSIQIRADIAPQEGDELTTPDAGDNQYTGTIVNVQADAVEGYEALAVIQIKEAEAGDLMLKNSDSQIVIQPLPYSFELDAS